MGRTVHRDDQWPGQFPLTKLHAPAHRVVRAAGVAGRACADAAPLACLCAGQAAAAAAPFGLLH